MRPNVAGNARMRAHGRSDISAVDSARTVRRVSVATSDPRDFADFCSAVKLRERPTLTAVKAVLRE